MSVNAEMAKALLELNDHYGSGKDKTNRPLRRKKIEEYARLMLAGKWKVTDGGIALSGEEGKEILLNGQHRLLALLLAAETKPDIEVVLAISKGLDPDVESVFDTGIRRTGGDVIGRRGAKNPNQVAAALRLVWLYDNVAWNLGAWNSFAPPHSLLEEMYEKYSDIEEANAATANISKIVPGGPLTAASFLIRREREDINLPEFLHGLKTGADLGERSPVLALRNYCLNRLKANARREPCEMLALTIRSFNHWVVDDRRTNLRFSASEPFPRLTDRKWVSR
jgi:hypothetical protein